MSRHGFLTVRAHETEPHVFEDMLILLLPIFHKLSPFTYHIEDDDTPSRHLHCFFTLPPNIKEKQKIIQKIETKTVKQFLQNLQSKQTIYSRKWDSHFNQVKLVPDTEEDMLKTLGYTIKETCKRSKSFHDPGLLRQALEFYMVDHRNKTTETKNSWKIITNKNFHFSMEEYAKKIDTTVHDVSLIPKMTHDKHSFQIRDVELKKYLTELRFANKKYDENSKEYSHLNPDIDSENEIDYNLIEVQDYCNYLIKLLKINKIEYQNFYENWCENSNNDFK